MLTTFFARFTNGRLIALLMLGLLSACTQEPTEQALRDTLDRLESAGEEREVNAFMDEVAEDFIGQDGGMDALALRRFLVGIQLRTKNITVTRTSTEIEIANGQARAKLAMVVTDGNGLLPSQGQFIRAETRWRFEQGHWLLVNARWQEGLAP